MEVGYSLYPTMLEQDHITVLFHCSLSTQGGWAKTQYFLLWSRDDPRFDLYFPLELAQESVSFSGCGQEMRAAGEDPGAAMEKLLSLNTSQMLMFICPWTANPLCK